MIRPDSVDSVHIPISHLRREPGSEPILGYRLIELLGQGGFGEVWKCEAPGGLWKAIKFFQGGTELDGQRAADSEELRAIEMMKRIRHPFLLSLERVEQVDGQLVVIMELADHNLFDVYNKERQAGHPGIVRDCLLSYLREAAEVLDMMATAYDLQHLDVKPQNLFLVSDHIKVGDFGVVKSFGKNLTAGNSGTHSGPITAQYSAPELFEGLFNRHCDQYSLAIVYHELLTGELPFSGSNSRQLWLQRMRGPTELHVLPASDRQIVARALSPEPNDRFPSCSDFVYALRYGQTEVIPASFQETAQLILPSYHVDEPEEQGPPEEPLSEDVFGWKQSEEGAAEERPYELVRRLRSTPLSESWEVRSANGKTRLGKVVFGHASEGSAIEHLLGLQHPALLPRRLAQRTPGQLLFVMPWVQRTLRDRFRECVSQDLPGIPRDELIGQLRRVASALDSMYQQHQVAHLGLNPRTVFLEDGKAFLADLGLVHLLWLPAGQNLVQMNVAYSAPELSPEGGSRSRRKPHPGGNASDQYSLSLIYHEMLTGRRPSSFRQLEAVPEEVRPALARALNPDPRRRWPTCLDLIRALDGQEGTDTHEIARGQTITAPSTQTTGEVIQLRFGTVLPAVQIRHRLEGFCEQWHAELVQEEVNSFLLHMKAPRSFWQRCTGQQPGLAVSIALFDHQDSRCERSQHASDASAVAGEGGLLTEVQVELRPYKRSGKQTTGADSVDRVALLLVDSIRAYLQVNPQGRREERIPWFHSFTLVPTDSEGSKGQPIACHGKDISLNGIGFYTPLEVPTEDFSLQLPETSQTDEKVVHGILVWMRALGNGWFEASAVLIHPEESDQESGSQEDTV